MLSAAHIRLIVALAALALAMQGSVRAQASTPVEISNTATCQYVAGTAEESPSGGAGPPVTPALVLSNEVRTPVVAIAQVAAFVLSATPSGTLTPGQSLQYGLSLRNGPDEQLSNVEIILPLDPSLAEPSSWSDGSVPMPGGGQIAVTGAYLPDVRALRWDIPLIAAGQEFDLLLQVPVLPAVSAETQVSMQGRLDALELIESRESNIVSSTVIPPVLLVQKLADRTSAAPGDGVAFDIQVSHAGTEPGFAAVTLVDILPPGLRYVDGSARIDEQPAAAVLDEDGRRLTIPLGPLKPGESLLIRLATVVGPLAKNTDVVNTAVAKGVTESGTPLMSAPATASVRIIPGPFRQEAYVMGRVFVDLNEDGMPSEDEPGIPGVLVSMEDGRGSVTDISGRWHIEGVRPGLHVARMEPATLPETLKPLAAGADWIGDPDTRFIEARASTLVVADFPVAPDGAGICQVQLGPARVRIPVASLIESQGSPRAESASHLDEAAAMLLASPAASGILEPQLECGAETEVDATVLAELRSRLRRASGARMNQVIPGLEQPPAPRRQTSTLAQDGTLPAEQNINSLEERLRGLQPQAAILSPDDAANAPRSRLDVEIAIPTDYTAELRVNGHPVPASRIGTTSVLPSQGVTALRYVGVTLDEGANRLHLRAMPPPGSALPVQEATAQVYLPGQAVALRLSVPEGRWVADGHTPAVLRVESIDGAGQVSLGREIVTLLIDGGRPLGSDLDPDEDGWQIRLTQGLGQLRLAPLMMPGQVQVQAYTDDMEAEIAVPVVPGAGEWTVLGLAEGRLAGDGGVEGDGGLGPGLNEQITDTGGRLALMARGPVGKASRLTISVDTDRKEDRDRLFGPYEPDAFFPASGDTSVRVDQAQTQGPVFVRLDAPMGFVQWGDFSSGFRQTELARYDRRLTGLSGEVSRGRFSFAGFASSTDQVVVRDVFSPDGTSGPFLLRKTPVVARSESIIVETRDRFRTEEVISRQVKLRDIDYTLDPVSGTIIFRGPLAPFDPEFNPVRVVVLYETRGASSDHITAGGRVAFRPTATLETGASVVHEERDGDPLNLVGLDLGWRPSPGLQVRSEIAHTDDGINDATAYRLEISGRHGATLDWQISYRDLPLEFANPTLLASPEIGTRRASALARWRPSDNWRMQAEALVQDDERTGLERDVVGVEAERRVGPVSAIGAVRGVRGNRPGEEEAGSMLVEAGVHGRFARRWTAEILRRQVLGDTNVPGYPSRTSAGITWEIHEGIRAVLRHEIESGDGPARDRTLVGLESRIGAYSRSFARYALQQGAEGSSVRSTTGIETALPLSPHSAVNLSAARIDTSAGDSRADYTTLTGGYEYHAGSARFSSRYEISIGETSLRHLLAGTAALRASPSWTIFARERISLIQPDILASAIRAEGLFGFSFRPQGGPWRFMARADHSTMSGNSVLAAGVQSGADGLAGVERPGLGFRQPRYEAGVSHDSVALTMAAGARVTPNQRLAATLIVRMVDDGSIAELPATITDLLSLHYTTVVHKRWTVGGSLRRFAQEDLREARFGAGVEVGYLLMKNLWITGGYNVAGFQAPGLPAEDRTERGPFMSFRFKFDESDWIPWRTTRLDQPASGS